MVDSEDEVHLSQPDRPLIAVNTSRGNVIVARHVDWAGTSGDRRRGLLGRDHLEPDHGLYLAPSQWIHTFRMRFPIDIAFLAADGRVLAVHHNLRPNRFSKIALRAEGALELAAGTLASTGTQVGDIICFVESLPSGNDTAL